MWRARASLTIFSSLYTLVVSPPYFTQFSSDYNFNIFFVVEDTWGVRGENREATNLQLTQSINARLDIYKHFLDMSAEKLKIIITRFDSFSSSSSTLNAPSSAVKLIFCSTNTQAKTPNYIRCVIVWLDDFFSIAAENSIFIISLPHTLFLFFRVFFYLIFISCSIMIAACLRSALQ